MSEKDKRNTDQSSVPSLSELGWDDVFERAFEGLNEQNVVPARVSVLYNHIYRILTPNGELLAEASGRLRHLAETSSALPAVGDWVSVEPASEELKATIRDILPRRSYFSRKAVRGRKDFQHTKEQVVAANIDVVLLVSGLDNDFNLKRIERYLLAATLSGAKPVIILNKADVRHDVTDCVKEVTAIANDVPIHVTSSKINSGLDAIEKYLRTGQTVAFLGSSGVGKSTIINRLLGSDRQKTQAVRTKDHRGRHTTVYRELIVRPEGGLIIDTPGMREIQHWDSDQEQDDAFTDITGLSTGCHFRNCQHRNEPKCAVRKEIDSGRLPASRLAQFHLFMRQREAVETQRVEESWTKNRK